MRFSDMRLWLAAGLVFAFVAGSTLTAQTAKTKQDWAQSTLKKMTLEEKVGQLFLVWARVGFINANSREYTDLKDELQKYHVGGFVVTVPVENGFLLRSGPLETAVLTNRLQSDSKLPLIFAADFERGLSMRLNGGTVFPYAMAFGAANNTDYAYKFGYISALEARAIGVQWNFFPDADVNSNPNNPIINTRSFGENPGDVSRMVAAYIRGAHEAHGLVTAKHFPGHGDTDTDSHLAVPRINANMDHLDTVELPPFQAAIQAGVDAVMVGHLVVPALDPDTNHVGTISHDISTKLLKEKMGFKGIVVTDAMEMNGVTMIFGGDTPESAGKSSVAAILAGADCITLPGDIHGAIEGVMNAVRRGEISESRLDESVLKMLQAKEDLGLDKNRLVDVNAVSTVVGTPENAAFAQKIADDSVTVVREKNTKTILPLPRSEKKMANYAYHDDVATKNHVLALIFVDDARSDYGKAFRREVLSRAPDAQVMTIDSSNAAYLMPRVQEAAGKAERVVVAVYGTPSAGRKAGAGGSSDAFRTGPATILADLLKNQGEKTVVVGLGNPYFLMQYPDAQDAVCTYSSTTTSELSAVKYLFGEIPAKGHAPVTIPAK